MFEEIITQLTNIQGQMNDEYVINELQDIINSLKFLEGILMDND